MTLQETSCVPPSQAETTRTEFPPPPEALMETLERLLRDGRNQARAYLQHTPSHQTITSLALIAAGASAIYGLSIGFQGGALQALASAMKIPLVLLGAAAISLPLLHFTCVQADRPLSLPRLSALVLHSLGTAAVTMAGLAPLIVVAWLTVSAGLELDRAGDTDSAWFVYRRVVLVGVAVATVGGLAGAIRLLRAVPLRAALPWALFFGLAGLQLSWLLRPVVGMPGGSFALYRPLESNALSELLTALAAVLG